MHSYLSKKCINNKKLIMKRLFIIVGVLFFTLSTEAQISITPEPGSIGVKISYGAIVTRPETTLIGNENDFLSYEVELQTTKPVMQIGVFGFKKIGYLWIEGDLMYSRFGNNYSVQSYIGRDDPEEKYDELFHYIDFQVLAGIHANNFRLGVGPVAHTLARYTGGIEVPDIYVARPRRVSFGFSGDVGYDLGNFKLDIKFETSFRSVGDHIYYGPIQSKFKGTPDMITLSMAMVIL